jgi:RimJ/RimL family protein N-acetyltransferase
VNLTLDPSVEYAAAWGWLSEFPASNFDDYGPRNMVDFAIEMERRQAVEIVRTVRLDGAAVGMIGYCPITHRTGMFRGICFTRSVHGSGIAQRAVRAFLGERWAEGVEKISASFFADNRHIHRFLAGLGAVDEGLLRGQTQRGGVAIDVRVVAIFKESLCLSAER